jgi:hypothetical protein
VLVQEFDDRPDELGIAGSRGRIGSVEVRLDQDSISWLDQSLESADGDHSLTDGGLQVSVGLDLADEGLASRAESISFHRFLVLDWIWQDSYS